MMGDIFPFRFVKVSNDSALKGCWHLRVDSIEELTEYAKVQKHMQDAIKDTMRVAAGEQVHFTNRLAEAFNFHMSAHDQGDYDIFQMNEKLVKFFLDDQLKALQSGTPIYINKAGGWFPGNSIDTLDEIRYSEKLIWPYALPSDAKISKWEGGTHYYARIGIIDVVDEHGNMKWNTPKQAERAVEEFMKGNENG